MVRRAGREGDGRWLLESDHPDWGPEAWPDEAEVIGRGALDGAGRSDPRPGKMPYTKRTFTRTAPPTVSTAPAGTRQVIRSALRSTTRESSTTNSGEVWITGSTR